MSALASHLSPLASHSLPLASRPSPLCFLLSQGHVSEKTDSFAFGVLLIELLTSKVRYGTSPARPPARTPERPDDLTTDAACSCSGC